MNIKWEAPVRIWDFRGNLIDENLIKCVNLYWKRDWKKSARIQWEPWMFLQVPYTYSFPAACLTWFTPRVGSAWTLAENNQKAETVAIFSDSTFKYTWKSEQHVQNTFHAFQKQFNLRLVTIISVSICFFLRNKLQKPLTFRI